MKKYLNEGVGVYMGILKRGGRRLQLFVLSMCCVLLAACEFEGLMPQYFDGVRMGYENEAVQHFNETGEVLNFDSERRYLFMNSTDVLTVPESEDNDTIELESGSYQVPEDLDAGEYNVKVPPARGNQAVAVLVYDTEDILVLELPIDESHMDGGRILLNDGYRLELRTSDARIHLRQDESREDPGFLQLNSVKRGMTVVGLHIPSGEYALMSSEVAIKRADGTSQVFLNADSTMYSGISASRDNSFSEFDLTGGGSVALESNPPVLVTLNDGDIIFNEHFVRLQKLEE